MDIRIRLDDYLDAHNLSAYRLVQAAKGRAAQGSVYALARGDMKRLDLKTLAAVMGALEQLTGERVGFDDLLERVEPGRAELSASGLPYTGDPETDAILDDPELTKRLLLRKAAYEGLDAEGVAAKIAEEIRTGELRPARDVFRELGIDRGRAAASPGTQEKGDLLELAGTFDDPTSPGDIAERHDHYLGEALIDEHREGLEGKR